MDSVGPSPFSTTSSSMEPSAFSPAEPRVDPAFVAHHNAAAEAYQIFKDDVDPLLQGRIAPESQRFVIDRILDSANVVIQALDTERSYLMAESLCGWAIRQQKLTIAAPWTQAQHYQALDQIDMMFEYFGELLEQTLSGLVYLKEHFPAQGFEELWERVRSMAHLFLYYSIIVSRQPPSVVVKCGEAENHRRSRFWFSTEVRVLGGRAFGIESAAVSSKTDHIRCYLITDETARQLLANAYHDVFESEEFAIEPASAAWERGLNLGGAANSGGCSVRARFDDQRVAKKVQLRRDSVATKRYCLCYTVNVTTTKHHLQLVGKKVSLPFAVLVGPKSDVEAKLFLERAFADLVRHPLSDIPNDTTLDEMADAMEMKFQAIVETPQKSADSPAVVQPRELSADAKRHLISRLCSNAAQEMAAGRVALRNFMQLAVCEEFHYKRGSTTEGEWKMVPFFEWFFKLAEIVNKHLYSMWYDRLIYGFCSKDDSERLLMQCSRPALLVRFSDIDFGKVKISARHSNGEIKHHWYELSELNARPLSKELIENPKYSDIELVYPDISVRIALGARAPPPRPHAPRNIVPSTLYFENQSAATSIQ